MDNHAQMVIDHLCDSYQKQLSVYSQLIGNGQKMLNALLLNRAQASSLNKLFEKKQQLVEIIETERMHIQTDATEWQNIKGTIEHNPQVDNLNHLLEDIEKAIRKFLTNEDQLRLHLEKFFGVSFGEPQT